MGRICREACGRCKESETDGNKSNHNYIHERALLTANNITLNLEKVAKKANSRGIGVIRRRCGTRGFTRKEGKTTYFVLGSESCKVHDSGGVDTLSPLSFKDSGMGMNLNSNSLFARGACSNSDKINEGVLGQKADRTEVIFGSKCGFWCKNLDRKESFMVKGLSVVSPGVLKRRSGRRSIVSMQGHIMILRSSKVCEKMKQQNPELINKVKWNLEDEVVKVFEKGKALGFNFYGRKNEVLKIFARRDEVNDNRFQDLVRRLVLKHKVMG
ncbi:hypothetical protein LWI28_028260 [Acer negundo]|uniref:Uncharacterized protein n=1 Tax=Acer negundo TaxID=4023 RepID=A0AAD5IHP4_ACENE|nr:hypothetical protein LWI28_028260 [Acer negundo]